MVIRDINVIEKLSLYLLMYWTVNQYHRKSDTAVARSHFWGPLVGGGSGMANQTAWPR